MSISLCKSRAIPTIIRSSIGECQRRLVSDRITDQYSFQIDLRRIRFVPGFPIPIIQWILQPVRHPLHIIGDHFSASVVTHSLTAIKQQDVMFAAVELDQTGRIAIIDTGDRKSTRLNSSHVASSYAVFCLMKKNMTTSL